mmetsp:Transcript_42350/g.90426  ORF Transcript_42350/g.90426 Transcript_42350/m.90426 type:complete len:80 (+) Transcript_42350:151-390(+)
MQLLLGTGFCGAFTTFSTYSVDTLKLLQKQEYLKASALVASSNVLSIAAAGAGAHVGARIVRLHPPVMRATKPPPTTKK